MADLFRFALVFASLCSFANAAVLHVGPKERYHAPSDAAAAAGDGDSVEIEAGTYRGDVAVWRANGLTLRGVNGRPVLDASGQSAEGKAIWVIKGDFTTVDNIAFVGAKVRDGNGAGIRQEGRDLVVRRCLFRDNQEGLLSGANPQSSIYIEDTEFAHNGSGNGYSHNLYIGEIGKLVVKRSYLHDAVVGHNLKSRALENVVMDNRFADEKEGNSSYAAEFPNGGQVLFAFNVIQKGPKAENLTLVSYGAEGLRASGNAFVAKGNTFINQHAMGGRFIFIAPKTQKTELIGNIFVGNGTVPDLPEIQQRNEFTMKLPGNADWRPKM
ncbi:MAG: hypothetical protein K2P57_02355 [Burkholderiales bacterium]|nr:hypothetical protein [Burkholderiales bacterium]